MRRSVAIVLFAATACGGTKPAPATAPAPEARAEAKIEPPAPPSQDGDETEDDGIKGGVVGGVVGPNDPPPPPRSGPRIVPQYALETLRVFGTTQVLPSTEDQIRMTRARKPQVVAVFKLCLGQAGGAPRVTKLKGSGYPDYDAALEAAVSEWVYKPFEINGNRIPVCSAVSFVFKVHLPELPPEADDSQ